MDNVGSIGRKKFDPNNLPIEEKLRQEHGFIEKIRELINKSAMTRGVGETHLSYEGKLLGKKNQKVDFTSWYKQEQIGIVKLVEIKVKVDYLGLTLEDTIELNSRRNQNLAIQKEICLMVKRIVEESRGK